ncbi:MAG TPA: ABC transporter permease [Anaerolineales bacterium]|nr:ABC transporter permease [Anaerolineales bacterium]
MLAKLKNSKGLIFVLVPHLIWIGVLFVLPHIKLFGLSFVDKRSGEITLGNYAMFFESELYRDVFVHTALFTILVTAITLAIAFPAAFIITKILDKNMKAVVLLAVVLPYWISELIRVFAWMVLLRETGVISYMLQAVGITTQNIEFLYQNGTIVIGLVYTSILFMIIPIMNSLDSLDDSLIEASYDLGGNFWSTMREIIIPHSAPGIMVGSIMVFMLNLGNYVTVTLLGGKNSLWFTENIYNQFIVRFNHNQGAAFGVILLTFSVLTVWIALKVTKQDVAEAM